jgi:hypothetical protein
MSAPAHDCLASALAAAQADFGVIGKDRSVNAGPKKYAYADLAAVLAVVRPALARHGIAITQRTRMVGEALCLVSELRFKAEVLDCEMPLLVDARNPQALGSYLSYARRYSLLALTGVQPEDEDDDGQAAKDAPHPPVRPQAREHASTNGRQHESTAEDDRGQRTYVLNGKRYVADDWIIEADAVARKLPAGKLSGFLESTKGTRNEIYKLEAGARDRLLALSEDLKARALGAASEGAA